MKKTNKSKLNQNKENIKDYNNQTLPPSMDYFINEGNIIIANLNISQAIKSICNLTESQPKLTHLAISIDEDKEMYDDQEEYCKSPFKVFKHYSNTSKTSSSTVIPFTQINTQYNIIDLRDKILIHDENDYINSNNNYQLSPFNNNQCIYNSNNTINVNNKPTSLWVPIMTNVN